MEWRVIIKLLKLTTLVVAVCGTIVCITLRVNGLI